MGKAGLSYIGVFTAENVAKMATKTADSMRNSAVKALRSSGAKMQADAVVRREKAFNVDTGRTSDSIKYQVDLSEGLASLTFYIDPTNVQVQSQRGSYNLTWILNDLTYGNYVRGAISPTADTVGGAKGTGMRPKNGIDRGRDFMGKSWNLEYPKLIAKLDKILPDALKKLEF
jgi:hypothetical protein